MEITLKQLEIFTKIAQNGTVSKAAEELFMTQSAASMALSEFEKSLDGKVFDRIGKRLSLNERGRALLSHARESVERTKEIERLYGKGSKGDIGELKIGASTTIGNYFLPRVLGRFLDQHPNIQLSMSINNTEAIAKAVFNYELDLGFIENIYLNPKLNLIPWRKDRLVLICSPKNPLAKKEKVTKNDLLNEQWILREQGSGSRSVFENSIRGKLENINVMLELGNTEAIKQAVASGYGISCVSLMAVKKMLWSNELVSLKVPFLNLTRELYLVLHKDKFISETIKYAVDYWKKYSLKT